MFADCNAQGKREDPVLAVGDIIRTTKEWDAVPKGAIRKLVRVEWYKLLGDWSYGVKWVELPSKDPKSKKVNMKFQTVANWVLGYKYNQQICKKIVLIA